MRTLDYSWSVLIFIPCIASCESLIFFLFYLQFPEHFKVYTYHMLYSGSDFLADIGGYLGLFLGLSLFGLVEIFTKVFDCKNKSRDKVNRKDSSADVEETVKLNGVSNTDANPELNDGTQDGAAEETRAKEAV